MQLPKIRKNLLVQNLAGEVLVYDLSTNKSYCLNETAKTVFNACDGTKTFADIDLPENIIYLSLDELKKNNLIAGNYQSKYAGASRREVIKQIGFGSMIALPVISSLIAPQASHAASGCVNPGGAAAGQPVGTFGCSTGTTSSCATACNGTPVVKSQCCSGNVTATSGGSCGLANCCVCDA